MSAILGFFFFLIIAILIFGLSIISGVLKFFFGFGKKQGNQQRTYQSNQQGREEENRHATQQPNRKKIFEEDEGEYVDFEEVKEDEQK